MDNEELKNKINQTITEISSLRGWIITKSIDIDSYIGAIINNYFVLSNRQSDFTTIVMSDPYFSSGLKISILNKIHNKLNWNSYVGFKKDLYRINELRNRFAHSVPFGFEGHLSYSAGEKPIKIKKAKEMYDEFMNLYSKILEELDKIFCFLVEESRKRENSVTKIAPDI